MPKFIAIVNMPGYMPDTEPHECDTFDEAKRCILEDLMRAEDEAQSEDDAATFRRVACAVTSEFEPFCTPTMPDGYRYSVQS